MFWADAPIYILVAAIASIITFYAESTLSQPQLYKAILYIDGLGAALFGIQGADKAWHYDFGGSAAANILGVVTAIGGGLIRDVLAGRKTLLMSYELIAIPVSLGYMLYVLLLNYFPEHAIVGAIACIVLIFAFRSAAVLLEPQGSSDVHLTQKVNDSLYLEVGMTNSAPLEILSGQRCMTLFCLV